MAKILSKEIIATVECPIRLMFGIGNNWIQGFSVVYEEKDKSVGSLNVWYKSDIDDSLEKVRFIDEGISRVVFEIVTVTKKNLSGEYSINERILKEILIEKDFQVK